MHICKGDLQPQGKIACGPSSNLFPQPSPLFRWFTARCLFLGNTVSLGPEGSGIICVSSLQFDPKSFAFFFLTEPLSDLGDGHCVVPEGMPQGLGISYSLCLVCSCSHLEVTSWRREGSHPRSVCYSLGWKPHLWSHSGVVSDNELLSWGGP